MKVVGYRIGERIYSSSATVVARGVREADGVAVVLKYPAAEQPTPSEIARYGREHELLQLVGGDRVVEGLALERVGHRLVLVCKDSGGETLARRFASTRPSLRTFLRVAADMARALAAVHAAGIIHKDLHPGNVVIHPDDRVKLIDFGIATKAARESQGLAYPDNLE